MASLSDDLVWETKYFYKMQEILTSHTRILHALVGIPETKTQGVCTGMPTRPLFLGGLVNTG